MKDHVGIASDDEIEAMANIAQDVGTDVLDDKLKDRVINRIRVMGSADDPYNGVDNVPSK